MLFVNNYIVKNLKFSFLLDLIFANLLVFLFSLIWLKFLFKNFFVSLLISAIIVCVFNLIFYYLLRKKIIKEKYNFEFKKDFECYFLTLLSNTKEENLQFFYSILKTDNSKIFKNKNSIIIAVDNKMKIAYCPLFELENLTLEIALKQIALLKNLNCNNIILLCKNIDLKTKFKLENLSNVNVEIYNSFDIANNIFKKYGKYPKINYTQKPKIKINLKLLYVSGFKKTNAKKFFLSGLFLFFCSFVIRNNIYYVLFSSILFFLSFLCLMNNKKSVE